MSSEFCHGNIHRASVHHEQPLNVHLGSRDIGPPESVTTLRRDCCVDGSSRRPPRRHPHHPPRPPRTLTRNERDPHSADVGLRGASRRHDRNRHRRRLPMERCRKFGSIGHVELHEGPTDVHHCGARVDIGTPRISGLRRWRASVTRRGNDERPRTWPLCPALPHLA